MPRMVMRQHFYMPSTAIARHQLYSTSQQPPASPSQSTKETKDSNSSPEATEADAAAATQAANLPSAAESRRSALNAKFSAVMDNLQARALTASQTLNDVTGYSSIEAIKRDNDTMEQSLDAAQERVRTARAAYKTSNTKRAATQREVTTLLARKDTWSPTDLERFTELYRTDHVLEGEVVSAQESLTEAEAEEQSLNQRLNAGILKRYHEEQIWSDRIRRASTWGTWGLMGMNFVLFVLLQFFAEPWRRKRLVRGVVEHEKDVLEGVKTEMAALKADLEHKIDAALHAGQEKRATDAAPVVEMAPSSASPVGDVTWAGFLQDPSKWKLAAEDLCSERQIGLRMRDASSLVLQGAMAGAAIIGSIALFTTR